MAKIRPKKTRKTKIQMGRKSNNRILEPNGRTLKKKLKPMNKYDPKDEQIKEILNMYASV